MTQLSYDNIFDAIADDADEAADLQFRADLMITLRKLFEDRGWKQADIASALGITQPRVSEIIRGKVHLFSADKLIGFLAKLNLRLKPSLDANHKVICEVLEAA
ncbi:XRE family transcriptional regulator [Mesorhizobium sp. B2-4-19]|uniref:helix-turn-helix domain-containing protein n=1 Tax=Mesorhizobium sp. B2-4-19 TaxID=2589930 RepID=UPI00112A414D|nr:XRE family transcriptional regulator [Mesorhizobium sp. B2-4-19]TPK57249.1 XRE family transcriptional regulator [Mesorhizobium sp. B2-4-19]